MSHSHSTYRLLNGLLDTSGKRRGPSKPMALVLGALAAAGLASSGVVQASTTIYEAFTGTTATTSTQLTGLGVNSTPTPGLAVDNGPNPGSDTWATSNSSYAPDFSTDGTQLSFTAPSGGYNYGTVESLPLTLAPNTTYVLSANADETNTAGNAIIGIGIGKNVIELSGSGWAYTHTTGYAPGGTAADEPYARTGTLTVTLVTASDLATGNSTVTFGYSPTNFTSTPVTVTGLTSSSNVSVYQYHTGTGSMTNYSLTSSTVPEPATLGLMGVGGLGLLLIGRKRKTA